MLVSSPVSASLGDGISLLLLFTGGAGMTTWVRSGGNIGLPGFFLMAFCLGSPFSLARADVSFKLRAL